MLYSFDNTARPSGYHKKEFFSTNNSEKKIPQQNESSQTIKLKNNFLALLSSALRGGQLFLLLAIIDCSQ